MKYTWKVQPAPTGKYRSFSLRGWPHAQTEDEHNIASIECADDYVPSQVKKGNHQLLTMRIRTRSTANPETFVWLKFNRQFATLQEAKDAFEKYVTENPEHDFCLPPAIVKRRFEVVFDVPVEFKHVRTFSELLELSDDGKIEVCDIREIK